MTSLVAYVDVTANDRTCFEWWLVDNTSRYLSTCSSIMTCKQQTLAACDWTINANNWPVCSHIIELTPGVCTALDSTVTETRISLSVWKVMIIFQVGEIMCERQIINQQKVRDAQKGRQWCQLTKKSKTRRHHLCWALQVVSDCCRLLRQSWSSSTFTYCYFLTTAYNCTNCKYIV